MTAGKIKKKFEIAIAGNPNAGKTTVFNSLTGMRQEVGNWPGVTVERLEGRFSTDAGDFHVVDLPGIYSLNAYSLDESISREYLLNNRPAVVVNVIDATNFERNIYLTSQLLEMAIPTVVVLNMMDIANQRKISIELDHLQKHLNCPIIPMVASKKQGLDELKNTIEEIANNGHISSTRVEYDLEVEEAIQELLPICKEIAEQNRLDPRWLAVKLLEGDKLAISKVDGKCNKILHRHIKHIETHTGEKIDLVIADGRYGFIHGLTRDVVRKEYRIGKNLSDAIDRVVLNRFIGLPLFILVMYGMFLVTINVGQPFIDFFDKLCQTVFIDAPGVWLTNIGAPGWVKVLLADGLGGGLQTIATLTPPIFLIFLSLSILQDSGYMARAAFVMDRMLRKIGLPGKAFIPLLVGFGCNVPGILASRTLEHRRDRLIAVLINPFMSCGARLPVYALFAVAFFPENGTTVVFSLYIIGIVMAIATAFIFKRTILKGEAAASIMELPPYHIPTLSGIWHHTWNRLKEFVVKAGKIILFVVIILNVLTSINIGGQNVLGRVGKSITPAFEPMGITQENWQATVGLCSGLFAKESVIGSLNSLYAKEQAEALATTQADEQEDKFDFWAGIGEAFMAIPDGFKNMGGKVVDVQAAQEDIKEQEAGMFELLRRHFVSKAAAYAYLLFVLLYSPCIAAIAAIYNETNLKWTIFSVFYQTFMAYLMAMMFYQIATISSHPTNSAIMLGCGVAGFIALVTGLKIAGRFIVLKD